MQMSICLVPITGKSILLSYPCSDLCLAQPLKCGQFIATLPSFTAYVLELLPCPFHSHSILIVIHGECARARIRLPFII